MSRSNALREESRLDLHSVIAHDLRGPLNTIMMRADLLLRGRRGPLSPQIAADVELMKQRMGDLVAMISDFPGSGAARGRLM